MPTVTYIWMCRHFSEMPNRTEPRPFSAPRTSQKRPRRCSASALQFVVRLCQHAHGSEVRIAMDGFWWLLGAHERVSEPQLYWPNSQQGYSDSLLSTMQRAS